MSRQGFRPISPSISAEAKIRANTAVDAGRISGGELRGSQCGQKVPDVSRSDIGEGPIPESGEDVAVQAGVDVDQGSRPEVDQRASPRRGVSAEIGADRPSGHSAARLFFCFEGDEETAAFALGRPGLGPLTPGPIPISGLPSFPPWIPPYRPHRRLHLLSAMTVRAERSDTGGGHGCMDVGMFLVMESDALASVHHTSARTHKQGGNGRRCTRGAYAVETPSPSGWVCGARGTRSVRTVHHSGTTRGGQKRSPVVSYGRAKRANELG